MKNKPLINFFLAANSADGFYSKFADNYSVNDWLAYIIKGGPGTGKSSIMRRFAKTAATLNKKALLCPCSSDPDSLDAVILPDDKIIILDGTAPHIVEPVAPGVCEQIINTGAFWDKSKLKAKNKEIIELCKTNKTLHKRAQQYIAAAGQLMRYNYSSELQCADIDKSLNFGIKLAKQHLKPTGKKPQEWVRFLSGITPKGFVFLENSLNLIAEKRIVICDDLGAVASIILSAIRDYALSCGYEIITVKNPILPNEITDHIIIPELKIAFCRQTDKIIIDNNERKIHTRRFINREKLSGNKEKIKFNRKAISELLGAAADSLKCAKENHDKIEKHYVEAMDFGALENYTTQLLNEIFPKK